MKPTPAGILPAVVTPLQQGDVFDPSAFRKLLARVYAAGVHGIYACGQTGEGLLLPVAVRKQVAEVAVDASPDDRCVIIHVGAARTLDAVELARHASMAGAHAVSALPPAGAYTFREVKEYYEAIANASTVPLYVYYFPEISPAIATLDQILELCAISNVAGLKFTDFDLYRLSLIRRAGYTIFNGRDEVFAAGMLMGANGGIGTFYNLVPELFVEMYQLSSAGRYKEAGAIQDRVNDLIRLTLRFPALAAVKRMLAWSGIDCGQAAAPRRELTPDEEQALRRALAEAAFSPEQFCSDAILPRE
jgi:N-acetylneuraminate lyase